MVLPYCCIGVVKISGSIKECTQTSNHLSGRGLVQPIKELSSAAERCTGRGCALIRLLANGVAALKFCFKTCVAMKFVDDDDDDDDD